MTEQPQIDKLRIFISHSWQDKPLARRLEEELENAGAEVWIDHSGIRGGDDLPERISNALEWCNEFVLLWSETASKSTWVKREWMSALTLNKTIIPCTLDGTELPAILAPKARLDFRDVNHGMIVLKETLNLAVVKSLSTEKLTSVPLVQLRSQPLDDYTENDVKEMLKECNFFHYELNREGKGINHQYEIIAFKTTKVIFDKTTGLTWQQSSSDQMKLEKTFDHLQTLNQQMPSGYSDWRLPTLEEAMSLMENRVYTQVNEKFQSYINSIFTLQHSSIWTSDRASFGMIWIAHFNAGVCFDFPSNDVNDVLAVR